MTKDNSYIKGCMTLGNATVYGGNSVRQRADDFPVHIYLEDGAKHWSENLTLYCPVEDFDIPRDSDLFHSAVLFAKENLDRGMDVFVGCLGGQGRTGMFMACLYGLFHEDESPELCIERVRSIYTPHAVETEEQEWFVESFLVNYRNKVVTREELSWSVLWKMFKALVSGKA